MQLIVKYAVIILFTIIASCLFLFYQADLDFSYTIPKRINRLMAIIVASICVATSSILFQTIVNNRILTPSIMGYEAVYLLWQALFVFINGVYGIAKLGVIGNFAISVVVIILYSLLLYRWLLINISHNIYNALLIGLVLTILFTTLTQFIQFTLNPGEFFVLQGFSYISFNRVGVEILIFSVFVIVMAAIFCKKTIAILNVMLMGKEQSISLGVDYFKYVKIYLIVISIMVAISTSMVGPAAFVGVFVSNITYVISNTRKHQVTLPLGCLIALNIFLIAQLSVEHLFNYKTTVGILINLFCGVYFVFLIIKRQKLI